jgi:hypothetical protein
MRGKGVRMHVGDLLDVLDAGQWWGQTRGGEVGRWRDGHEGAPDVEAVLGRGDPRGSAG